jgi:hypothetical protein
MPSLLPLPLQDLKRALQSSNDTSLHVYDLGGTALMVVDEAYDITYAVEMFNDTEYCLSFPLTGDISKDNSQFPPYFLSLLTSENLLPRQQEVITGYLRYGVGMSFRWAKEDTTLLSNFDHAMARLRDFKYDKYDGIITFLNENGTV